MPLSRPYWKGYLKLSLVSCPIALYASTSSTERVTFRQISKKTGNRLKQQLVDEGTGEVVEAADKGRGYEVAKHTFLPVEDEDFDGIAIESRQTIDIDKFVPRAQIDERYLDGSYYLVPDDKVGQDAFAVIRDAMRGKEMVALGRIVMAKRERLMMLQPWDKGLLGMTLRYPYEVRDADTYFAEIPDLRVAKDMLQLAEHILDSKAADFDPSQFHDRYEEAMIAMLKTKQEGHPVPASAPVTANRGNVVDLMEALKRSLAGAPKPAEVLKAKTPRKRSGQSEMLLPISGSGSTRATKKAPASAALERAGAREGGAREATKTAPAKTAPKGAHARRAG